jgi:pimeloyl-ACP methyl ester carboxylesterase
MAKIELKNEFRPFAPNLILIPGGPGLGPVSFGPLATLIKNINVFFYYPTGTYGDHADKLISYEEQIEELKIEVENLDNVYLCGHSFGGIQAVDLALRISPRVKGIICIASPFSSEAFKEVERNGSKNKTLEQIKMDDVFVNDPSNENYKRWFASYAHLYFSSSNVVQGHNMLLDDSVNVKNYLGARAAAALKEQLLMEIKKSSIRRLFVTGEKDRLLPVEILREESSLGGFMFKVIKDAGHFVHFDQAENTSALIEEFVIN